MNKLVWLEATLEAMKPDIIGITESWCNEAVGEAEISMAGYDMFRADRSGGIRGGGVLLYTKSELGALYYKTKCEGEHICCRIPQKGKGEEIIIAVNYRSDNIQRLNYDTNAASRELIKELQPKNFVIMGDYNYPDIDWENNIGVTNSSKEFLECLEDGFLTQHVKEPTRGPACLDLIISKDPDLVKDVEVIGQFLNSDHSLIKCKIVAFQPEAVTKRQLVNYSRADFTKIRKIVGELQWELQGDAEEAWDDFRSKLLAVEDKLIPKVSGRAVKRKTIWMNKKATTAVRNKYKVYSKFKRAEHPACVKAEKKAKKEVENARKSFENKLARNIKTDVKSFFAYARSKSKTKVGVGPQDDGAGSTTSSDEGMCEVFNEYFASVFTLENMANIPEAEQRWRRPDDEALSDIHLDARIVEEKLSKLRADKSTGADGLSPRLLKEIKAQIVQPIL